MRYFFLFVLSTISAVEIKIGPAIVEVEVADTPSSRKKGLSGRASLADGTGMLFIFDSSQICSFWMKDTKIPLSIGFFDSNRKLTQRIDMFPPDNSKELTIYTSAKLTKYALEVPCGWFRENHIHPGETFEWIETQVHK